MSDEVITSTVEVPQEAGPQASNPSDQDAWAQAVADLDPNAKPSDPNAPKNISDGDPHDPSKQTHDESVEENSATQEQDETEGSENETDWKAIAGESEAKLKALEAKLEALSAKLEQPQAPEPEPPKVPETPFEMTQEVKDLLEYTPGLDKLVEHEATKVAREILKQFQAEENKAKAEAEKQRESQQQETTYWEEVGNWFSGEYPELTLQNVRESPDFNDWLNLRKNWVDTQLSSKGRYDTSGAKAVYERYVKENLPNSQRGGQGENADNAKRLAAARSPSARSTTQASAGESTDVWSEEVSRLKSSGTVARQYI